jgi:hypothetical protein
VTAANDDGEEKVEASKSSNEESRALPRGAVGLKNLGECLQCVSAGQHACCGARGPCL